MNGLTAAPLAADPERAGPLTAAQDAAVTHEGGPLLLVAGAGTGKTTVIARRIAWLIASRGVAPEQILALTFSDKAASQMEERVDLLVPYGYVQAVIKTFHAFGDELLRAGAARLGLSSAYRVLSSAEQLVFLRRHAFDLPLRHLRPTGDPTRHLELVAHTISRAKDEAASPARFVACARRLVEAAADPGARAEAERCLEMAQAYEAYQRLLRDADLVDFGDQVLLALELLERHPDVRDAVRQRFAYILVDEFQDTNVAQFRLLQALTGPEGSVTVVADDDQSIYRWRGAALSNVLKFLDGYRGVRTAVLVENFRSGQPILDCAYRLIRHNDPDRLEVRQGISKRLIACASRSEQAPQLQAFDTVSTEADWVASTIRSAVESGRRRPGDFAVLVRSNRDADPFLRALNVAGIPWRFSGASGLYSRDEVKLLLSCLRTLADPDDTLSWYHVASSPLYQCAMPELLRVITVCRRTHRSFRQVLEQLEAGEEPVSLSGEAREELLGLLRDVSRLQELSRSRSPGQLLYEWLSAREWLRRLARPERAADEQRLQSVAAFFAHLQRVQELVGDRLPELMQHLELLQSLDTEPWEEDDAWADRVHVLSVHRAKGLEFPVVFMVGLVQGRFPIPDRRERLPLPEELVTDAPPPGDQHLREERRLFYVGMTRAKEELFLTYAQDYGGKTRRKMSQFIAEALELAAPGPQPAALPAAQRLARLAPQPPLADPPRARSTSSVLRLHAYSVDDYLTCPLKYRYSHVLRLPILRHHLVMYGAAVHDAVAAFFTRRLAGQEMAEEELLACFKSSWRPEGFLTREHETQRLEEGRAALRRFFQQQRETPERPSLIEASFRFRFEQSVVVGRWDRVDVAGGDAVIIDYKTGHIADQPAADRRARESLQLSVYALAWQALHGRPPLRVELHFLETGFTGSSAVTEERLEQARGSLRAAAAGVEAGRFDPQPSEHSCRWCAYQGICPSAFGRIPPVVPL